MDNRSMTLESWFYLKAYCTAIGRGPYRKSGKHWIRSTAGVNSAAGSEFAAHGAMQIRTSAPRPRRWPFERTSESIPARAAARWDEGSYPAQRPCLLD